MKRYTKLVLYSLLLALAFYGSIRLYYRITHGFAISNITSELPYDKRWDTRSLTENESEKINQILDQKFFYLGKGCQSYVFASEDGQYVLKFFKYQRYRVQPWFNYFAFIPIVAEYRDEKMQKKNLKREGFFHSWKLAFDELQLEAGLVYVHLNKTNHLHKSLEIYDKMGFVHHVEADAMEFLIQKKASMLCAHLQNLVINNNISSAKQMLDKIVCMILSENERGIADNDHALMQNTGVLDGNPVHIDVGQFVYDESVKDEAFRNQQLFNKTYKFRKWLNKESPELANYLEANLINIIGPAFFEMQPHFKPHE